jgi:hypothetical protein
LYAERCVLVGHYVIFVLWIDGLEVRWDVDVFRGELGGGGICEGLEEVGVV